MITLLALIIGLVIGLSLGLLGGGGSILTVPALVYLLGQDVHVAVTTSLVIVGMNALAGAWMHWRNGQVRLQEALLFGLSGILAAYAGAQLSQRLPEALLLVLFALLMIAVATLMLCKGTPAATDRSRGRSGRWGVVAGGVIVGFLTGLLGVGGGFLIVPALVLLLRMGMHEAVGSSLVVITLNSASGFAGHIATGGVDWALSILLLGGGIVGIAVGARLVPHLPTWHMRQAFALFVALLGTALLAINLPGLLA